MNTVRIPRLLKQTTLLLTFMGLNLLLTACGGGGGKSSTGSSSSSSSASSHTFSSTPVTPPLNGTWPNVRVSASHTKTLNFDWTAAPDATYYKLFKKADANSAYAQVGSDFTANTISDPVAVHLTDWVNSRYKVQACTAADVCTDSSEVIVDSAMLSAITYIKASNTDADDWFGWSIALSGDGKTLAVGAPAEASNAIGVNNDSTSNASPTSGAVYVFVKVDGNWVQEAYLKASNTEQPSANVLETLPNDRFGFQISLSDDGSTLAVSAINEDSPSYGINCNQANYIVSSKHINYNVGAIYIFKRSGATWSQAAYVKPTDTLRYVLSGVTLGFGTHIALSGDGKTLAVGSEIDPYEQAGVQMASSSASSTVCFDYANLLSTPSVSSSSHSSSSSSSITSSSSSISNVLGGSNSGAVYIFRETESGWVEEAHIKASDAYAEDRFGASIELSYDGDTLAVGAVAAEVIVTDSSSSSTKAFVIVNVSGNDYGAELNSGAVYVFKRTGDLWQESSKIIPANQGWNQQFGYSVSLSDDGKTLAVGTPGDWSLATGTTGSPTNYTYEAELRVTSNGYSYIIPKVSTTREKSSYASGAAYIYQFSDETNTWIQEGYLKASNPKTANQFGYSLSLSGNGDVLAVGSYLEASLASGINGDQLDTSSPNSGAAYVFKRSASIWAQQSYVKAPKNHADDRFSRALSLDFTGDILAIGAHRESSNAVGINGNGNDNSSVAAGAVYVY